MEIKNEPNVKVEEYNAWLVSLFLFQYSLLIPLAIFVNATILVSISSCILLFLAFVKNRLIRINFKIVALAFIILLLILLKTFIYQDKGYSVLFSFFTIVCPSLYIISLPFDRGKFLDVGYRLAIITFFLIFWIPVFSVGIDYMRFGYGMAPVAVFLYCQLTHNRKTLVGSKKIFTTIIFLLSMAEIVVFGARGSIIPVFLIILINMFIIKRINIKTIASLGLFVLVYFNLETIIDAIFELLNRLNIHSYSLIKIRMQINKGFAAASSGREAIYENSISRIKQKPFFGNDLTGGVGDTYPHNIFLQITEEFGLIALIVFLVFLFVCLKKMFNKKIQENERLVFAILFSLSFGRLIFSSSYWMRPEFWLFVGFGLLLNTKSLNNERKKNEDC